MDVLPLITIIPRLFPVSTVSVILTVKEETKCGKITLNMCHLLLARFAAQAFIVLFRASKLSLLIVLSNKKL